MVLVAAIVALLFSFDRQRKRVAEARQRQVGAQVANGTHALYVDSFYPAGTPCGGQGNNLCGNGPYTLSVTGVLPAELIDIRIE